MVEVVSCWCLSLYFCQSHARGRECVGVAGFVKSERGTFWPRIWAEWDKSGACFCGTLQLFFWPFFSEDIGLRPKLS